MTQAASTFLSIQVHGSISRWKVGHFEEQENIYIIYLTSEQFYPCGDYFQYETGIWCCVGRLLYACSKQSLMSAMEV